MIRGGFKKPFYKLTIDYAVIYSQDMKLGLTSHSHYQKYYNKKQRKLEYQEGEDCDKRERWDDSVVFLWRKGFGFRDRKETEEKGEQGREFCNEKRHIASHKARSDQISYQIQIFQLDLFITSQAS